MKSDKSERMEIKKLRKALEEKEASAGGFDGFDNSNSNGGRMRIATITAVARAFNNASRRRPPCQPPLGESSLFKQCHFCRSKVHLAMFRLYGFQPGYIARAIGVYSYVTWTSPGAIQPEIS